MPALRILHVLGAMDYGGIETWLMQVLRRTDPGLFRFDFCCLSGRPGIFSPEITALGGRVFALEISHMSAACTRFDVSPGGGAEAESGVQASTKACIAGSRARWATRGNMT